MLLVDSVSTLALVGFEGLDLVTSLFQRAGHKSANCVSFPMESAGQVVQRDAVLVAKHGDCLSHLTPLARSTAFLRLDAFLGLRRAFRGGGLLGRLPLNRRALRGLCATLGLSCGLRLFRRRVFRLRFPRAVAKALNSCPDALNGGIAAGELLDRGHARQ